MADRVGQQLGSYRLVRLLGRGGFAEVYLGEHLRLNTQAAIKILHTSLEDDDVDGFLREAQMVARLRHPHIVRVFDFDVENHTPFLVMDYLPNGNVRRLYPKGTPLPLQTIFSYVTQVASALQYAHDEKLIHRDIKPENMLLDRDNTLVLSDFGIALMSQSSRYQSTREVVGTAAYMAPEQFQGHPRRASDQYALAVVVYEWLTGDRPFHGTFTEIYSQHLFVPPRPLREKVPTLPQEIEQVVLTALEKDPRQRFESVKEFANALEQAWQVGQVSSSALTLRATTPLSTTQPKEEKSLSSSSPTRLASDAPTIPNSISSASQTLNTPKPVLSPTSTDASGITPSAQPVVPSKGGISRRTVLIGLAGLSVAGAAGLVTWLELKPGLKSENSPATIEIYRGHSGDVESVAWSPDGKYIVSGSGDGTAQVWEALTGKLITDYKGHTTYVSSAAWSPDGKYIVSGGGDNAAQVWEALTGNPIIEYTGHSSSVYSAAWSSDGMLIASGSYDNTVQVWEAKTSNRLVDYTGHSDAVYSVAWSPDGKYIVSGSRDNTAKVWEALTGQLITNYTGYSSIVHSVAWSPDGKYIVGASVMAAQVWEALTGQLITDYRGHPGVAYSAAWSPDGKYIVSGGIDPTPQVWEAKTGNRITEYNGHTCCDVYSVAWSPDGKYIVSGAYDKTAQVWVAP